MIIGVDLDEVLSETIEKLLEDNNYYLGYKKVKKEDLTDYYLFRIKELEITSHEVVELFRKILVEDKKYKLKPVKGAYKKLKFWKEKGYKLKIITARPEIFKDYTLKWLDKYYPHIFDDIIFASDIQIKFDKSGKDTTKKSIICQNLGVDVMIEDNPEYANDIANCGIKTYLITKPWNINYNLNSNIIRVNSWEDIKI